MTAQFKIGDKVKAVAFTDCFGKPVAETLGMIVETVRLIEPPPEPACIRNPSASYYCVMARAADGFGYIEGAERYFAAE